jgi:uncharacterized protein
MGLSSRWHRQSHDAMAARRATPDWKVPSQSFHIHTALMPPLIFFGLFITLWSWKCIMLVVFQNTIIYNPFLPPDARRLRIADYARHCGGIRWREETIRSLDRTHLSLCVCEVDSAVPSRATGAARTHRTTVYILYLQGSH